MKRVTGALNIERAAVLTAISSVADKFCQRPVMLGASSEGDGHSKTGFPKTESSCCVVRLLDM